MMTKRILALMLSSLLVLSVLVAVPTAVGAADTVSERAYSRLKNLDLLTDALRDNFDEDGGINRGEFTALAIKVSGLSNMNPGADLAFADVPESYEYYKEIMTAAALGYISGDGLGNFSPNGRLEAAQAIKIIIAMLGYDKLAELKGGYPIGYMVVANDIDLLSGITITTIDSKLTQGLAVELMSNAVHTQLAVADSVGDDYIEYNRDNKETILSAYHGIITYEGRLTGTPSMLLADVAPLDADMIMIDNAAMKYTGSNCDELIGQRVYYYYGKESKLVLALEPVDYTVKRLTIKGADVSDYTGNSISYYDEDGSRERKLSLDPSADIIFNGKVGGGVTKADICSPASTIELISTKGSSAYDLLIVKRIENLVVEYVDVENNTIYDKYDTTKKFHTDNPDDLIFLDEFGNNMDFSELVEYDVVSVVESKDGTMTALYYSNSEREGTIESMDAAGSVPVLTVDGKELLIAENYISVYSSELSINSFGIFLLDIAGNIAGFKGGSGLYEYGYLVAMDMGRGLDSSITYRMYTKSGELKDIKSNDKLTLDGVDLSAKDAYNTILSESATPGDPSQLIRYYLAGGKMRAIDTVNGTQSNEGINTLKPMKLGYDASKNGTTQMNFNGYQNIFGMKYPFSASPVVFTIPKNLRDAEEVEFGVYSASYFVNDYPYYVNLYSSVDGSHGADAVVTYIEEGSANIDRYTLATIVTDVTRAIYEDNATYKIKGYYEGDLVSYTIKEASIVDGLVSNSDVTSKHTLACGDIVRLKVNEEGIVSAIELIYEYDIDKLNSDIAIATEESATSRGMRASVYSKDKGNILITKLDPNVDYIDRDTSVESVQADKFAIYKYKVERGTPVIEKSSVNELIPYKLSNNGYSEIVMWSRYVTPGIILIRE